MSSRSSSRSATTRASRRDVLDEAHPPSDIGQVSDNDVSDIEDELVDQPPLADEGESDRSGPAR